MITKEADIAVKMSIETEEPDVQGTSHSIIAMLGRNHAHQPHTPHDHLFIIPYILASISKSHVINRDLDQPKIIDVDLLSLKNVEMK